MSKNYKILLSNLQKRMNPENYSDNKLYGDIEAIELRAVSGSAVMEYIKRSMQGVGPEYTEKSLEAGSNVKGHLRSVLSLVDYAYQGSVMTNTHIRGNSDIDLLILCDRFYFSDKPRIESEFANAINRYLLNDLQKSRLQAHYNAGSYFGNTNQDLLDIRLASERKLRSEYLICDISKPKSIAITNQHLHRDVDVVVAAWHKTFEGIKEADSKKDSIRIYDKVSDEIGRIESPFVSIERINNKDTSVNGRLKKMIRFAKTLKCDADLEIDLSSFDINAVCYNIDANRYSSKSYYELVPLLYQEFERLNTDTSYRDSLMSVDGSEYIFRGKVSKIQALRRLCIEFEELLTEFNVNLVQNYVRQY